jgi:hypothetical protein
MYHRKITFPAMLKKLHCDITQLISEELDQLPLLVQCKMRSTWTHYEVSQIIHGLIPLYFVRTNQTIITGSDGATLGHLEHTPLQEFADHIQQLESILTNSRRILEEGMQRAL